MKLFTISTDDACWEPLQIFADESAADAAALAWCRARWYQDGPCPEDWKKAHSQIRDGEDFMWYEIHDIDDTDFVKATIKSAQAQIAQLVGQIDQMYGLFDDADGTIAQAVADAEFWPEVLTDQGEPSL